MPREATSGSAAGWDELRREMLAAGCPNDLVAREIERRGGLRPREAHRLARGWTRRELAAQVAAVGARLPGAACCPQWTAPPPGRAPPQPVRPAGGRRSGAGRAAAGRPAEQPVDAAWVGQLERWPHGSTRPCPHVLAILAAVLGTTIGRLLDYDDHRHLTDAERAELAQLAQWGG